MATVYVGVGDGRNLGVIVGVGVGGVPVGVSGGVVPVGVFDGVGVAVGGAERIRGKKMTKLACTS